MYDYFQETIKDQVAKMYLWPKALEVQILDPVKYVSDCFLQYSYFLIVCSFILLNVLTYKLYDEP